MEDPILLIDTWQFGGAIDEALLSSKGVTGILVRLNDINGGHHIDPGFSTQWEQARALKVRIPYFVYNPWVSGQANFDYLASIMPAGAISIALDIEVIKSGYSPAEYAAQVDIFYKLVKGRWNCIIYTGEWFLKNLSYWPKFAKYWWAQYPNALYPPGPDQMSWEELRGILLRFVGPSNPDKVPSYPDSLAMWQCSGDRLILPGCEKPMDVNVWMESIESLIEFAGQNEDPEIPDPGAGDKKYVTHIGVEAHIIERFGSKCIVHIIDPQKARVFVTPGPQTVSAALKKYGAQIGTNGGGWPNIQTTGHRANEIWASNGLLLQATALHDRGYINISNSGNISVSENSRLMGDLYNAWGFDRILGKDGVFNPRITDRTVKDARTGAGISEDGKLIILSAEGNDRFQHGLTFPEMWEVLEEFGAAIAGNCDGGSSSAVVNYALSKDSLILPSDGGEARVINQVLIFADAVESNPDPGDEETMADRFLKVTETQKERVAPSMFNANSRTGQPNGTIIKFSGKVPAVPLEQDLIKDTDSRSDALFVKTASGWYQPAFYQGKWNMVEVPDPSLPEDPEVPLPADAKDFEWIISGIVIGKLKINGEEWIRKI